MSTGTNIAIGVGAVAAAFGIYWFFIREAEEVAGEIKKDETSGGSSSGGGGSATTGVLPGQGRGDGISAPKISPIAVAFKTPGGLKPSITPVSRPSSTPIIKPTVGQGRGGATAVGRGVNGSVSWSNACGYIC